MNKIHCVIIDDEPLARTCIMDYVSQVDFLNPVGSGSHPLELTQILEREKVDLVFLDIQMPVMNGIEYLKMTKEPPMVVLTTAYPSYALEGFELDVLDYLVKPITFNRFFKAASKVKEYHELKIRGSMETPLEVEQPDYFFIKCDYRFDKIFFDDILYVEGMQNYVTIHTVQGKFVTLLNMKGIEEKLNFPAFMRVHKSFIAALPKVQCVENNQLIIGSARIPISRNYREAVMQAVLGERLWKK
ncbi:LytR/AlgR family response regulator transcription factor [Reichenbachiella ulvae]|uniref:LytTR family DNA-binding domain-containing protein n=1 Tax=Reichenbachiella ulvae TaxID=2980104 RepID=A0ABT3CN33_9BACT|nr:LytTR family DNA-binding domain-containing protein [Reichenbachiella ulvae]MCV9385056.1 LytTR family DNA-binding domain-containing protein [Reichenbachiella ulvae]